MPEENNKLRVFRGGGRTILQLIIASIIVGAIFSFVGLSPQEFWRGIFHTFQNLITTLGDSLSEIVGTLAAYLLIGAAIVIPIWLIRRVFSSRK
jgi:ABC-type multidrug transport system permease subunit